MYILLFRDGNMLFFEDLALFTFKVHLCLHALVVLLSKSDVCSTVLAILFWKWPINNVFQPILPYFIWRWGAGQAIFL